MGRQPGALLERPGVPTPDDSRPAMLTVKQVARTLGVNAQTVRRAVKRGELLGGSIGTKILINRKEFCEQNHLQEDYDFGPP